MDKKYVLSYELNEISAKSLPEFVEKIEKLIQDGKKISLIAAVVATNKSLDVAE